MNSIGFLEFVQTTRLDQQFCRDIVYQIYQYHRLHRKVYVYEYTTAERYMGTRIIYTNKERPAQLRGRSKSIWQLIVTEKILEDDEIFLEYVKKSIQDRVSPYNPEIQNRIVKIKEPENYLKILTKIEGIQTEVEKKKKEIQSLEKKLSNCQV